MAIVVSRCQELTYLGRRLVNYQGNAILEIVLTRCELWGCVFCVPDYGTEGAVTAPTPGQATL